jgi:hypothetical protein
MMEIKNTQLMDFTDLQQQSKLGAIVLQLTFV